jgi:hypothetical protein
MQENRSFDHYFGTMRGVRGFNDPRAVKLPSGKPVWNQPDGSGELLPFRPDVKDVGKMFLPDPPHGWTDSHAAWNGGKYDLWVANKGVQTMTYHTREDLPYQYALADAFTVCDNYHCSLLGPTDPNRYHMWTGWVGNDGQAGGPVITNAEAGYDWSTCPERLERNGISWKVYQDVAVGLDAAGYWGWTSDAFIGNCGDNSLLYFHQYQNAAAGTPLADSAKTGTNINAQNRLPDRLFDVFREDVQHGRLPQVSWIVGSFSIQFARISWLPPPSSGSARLPWHRAPTPSSRSGAWRTAGHRPPIMTCRSTGRTASSATSRAACRPTERTSTLLQRTTRSTTRSLSRSATAVRATSQSASWTPTQNKGRGCRCAQAKPRRRPGPCNGDAAGTTWRSRSTATTNLSTGTRATSKRTKTASATR